MMYIKILRNAMHIKEAVFDMTTGMHGRKQKLRPIVTALFNRSRKIIISLVFITQCYFAVPKNIRLNSMHYFIMEIKILILKTS